MYFVWLDGTLIHSPYPRTTKLSAGVVIERDFIDTFEFEVNKSNPAWDAVVPLKSIVRVVNANTGYELFNGRVFAPTHSFGGEGMRAKYVATDRMSYLNDSRQTMYYHEGNNISAFLQHILTEHNAMLPNSPEKHFKLGSVTVTDPNDLMKRFINDGDNTLDVLKTQLKETLGGYFIVRAETDGLYLDYLDEVGRKSDTGIIIQRNLQELRREIDITVAKSIVVPYGAVVELPEDATDESIREMGTKRVDITSVNGGKPYLVDNDLAYEIGEIAVEVIFEDVEDPAILMQKGLEWQRQHAMAIVNYQVTPIDLSLKQGAEYEQFESFELFNWHEIYSPVIPNMIEDLQIVEKKTDILNFHKCDLTFGSKHKRLSDYRAMMKKDKAKYIERLAYQDRAQRLANRRIKKITDDLTEQQNTISDLLDDVAQQANDIASTQATMSGVIDELNIQSGTLTSNVANLQIFRNNTESRLTRIFNALDNADIPY